MRASLVRGETDPAVAQGDCETPARVAEREMGHFATIAIDEAPSGMPPDEPEEEPLGVPAASPDEEAGPGPGGDPRPPAGAGAARRELTPHSPARVAPPRALRVGDS